MIFPPPSARWHLPLLALVVTAVYLHTLDAPFYLDDFSSIRENPVIYQQQGLAALWQYAPLRIVGYLSFALNYALHQFDTAGYHLFNILVHFLTGCAVYGLARGLLRAPRGGASEWERSWLPLLAALLFVLHPLHTQAVTYIVQRLAALAALFYLASLAAFVQARLAQSARQAWLWGMACAGFALLGLFTKQNTATLPLALLLAELLFFRAPARRLLIISGAALGGLLLIGLLATLFRYSPFSLEAMQSLTRETFQISRADYLATQSGVLWHYLRLFAWPAGLRLDYEWPVSHFGELLPWLAGAGHLLVIGAALALARRWPLAAFGVLFYYLAHSVESSLIPIRDVIFEHRAYLPDAGLCLALAWLAARITRPAPPVPVPVAHTGKRKRKKASPVAPPPPRHDPWRALGLAGISLALAALATVTWQRNQVWRDPIALWQDNVAKAPDKPRAWGILGKHYLEAGQTESGVAALEQAIRLQQQQQQGRVSALDLNNLVIGLKHLKRHARALELVDYMLAQPMEPQTRAKFLVNRGNLLVEQNRQAEAEQAYHEALAAYPPSILARANLANLLGQTGRTAEARRLYEEVLEIDPGNPVFQENLRSLRALGQPGTAGGGI